MSTAKLSTHGSGEWRTLLKRARQQGWRIEKGRKKLKLYAPSGGFVSTSLTPSDVRSVKNCISWMTKYGYVK